MIPAWISELANTLSGGRRKCGWWSSSYQSQNSPIILGGCPRSGTTLSRSMLNAHPNISIGPETGIFCGNNTPEKVWLSIRFDKDAVTQAYLRSSCIGRFAEEVCGRILNTSGKQRWGDKSAKNIGSIDLIFKFFPKARFIHIMRDGRDAVCSLRTNPEFQWENGKRVPTGIINPWDSCVREWAHDVRAGLKWRHDDRYTELRYEALANTPEVEMRRILEWLGEPWDDGVLGFHKTHDETHSDAPNPGVKKPVYQSSVGRWQRDLPSEARRLFAGEAAELLVELGYASDDSWLSTDPLTDNDIAYREGETLVR